METTNQMEVIFQNKRTIEQFKAAENVEKLSIKQCEKNGTKTNKCMFTYGAKVGYVAQKLAEDIIGKSLDTSKSIEISDISRDGGQTFVTTMHYEGTGGYETLVTL